MHKKLSAREVQFIHEYAKDWSGKFAAIRAGYAPKSAKVRACVMLRRPDIAAAIAELRARHQEKIASELAKFEPLVDSREAAQLVRMNFKSLQAMAADGKIPAFRVGGRWRFRISELNRWIDERRVTTADVNVG